MRDFSDPNAESQSVIAVHLPGGREFLWLTPGSPVLRWQVGEAVVFKSKSWVVSERLEQEGLLTLTLDEAA
jgi:hypothetical protein